MTQKCKYTRGKLGEARLISCEFDKHGKQCQHGDCTCNCHKNETETCQCCSSEEATEQLSNESGLYVCYGCKIAQRDVT